MKIRLFFALLIFMASPAFAVDYSLTAYSAYFTDPRPIVADQSAGCDALLIKIPSWFMAAGWQMGSPDPLNGGICHLKASNGQGGFTPKDIGIDFTCTTQGFHWSTSQNKCLPPVPTCTAPNVLDPSTNTCVAPCTAGVAVSADVGLGMFPYALDGTSSAIPFFAAAMHSICATSSTAGVFCTASGGPSSFYIQAVSNGTPYADVVEKFSGTLTGATCSGPVTPALITGTPPPCAGQSGTVNGLIVCMPTETEAAKQARIAQAAAAAATSARAAAIAAGKTAAEAATAGSAAGAAAATAAAGGVSATASAAAGAAAGAASVTAGATSASTAAAGSGAAADASAKAASTAAGLSSATGTAAGTAANSAASAASAAAKSAGASDSAAAKAGAAAGVAAGGASVSGASAADVAAAGAAAGAAAAAKAAVDEKAAVNPITEYCTLNPDAAICKKSLDGKFQGTCADTAPACTGDAIQCATAAASFKSACALSKLLDVDSDTNSIFAKASDGRDGINTDLQKTAAHANAVSIGSFDQSGKGWSRSCPADPVINISWGHISTWTLPLSQVCSPLEILARAAVGITLLGALVWVIGGSKS